MNLNPGYYTFSESAWFNYVGPLKEEIDEVRIYESYKNRILEYYSNATNNLGILFEGVSGSGKTFLAKQLLSKLNLPVIIVSHKTIELLIDKLINNELQVALFLDSEDFESWTDEQLRKLLLLLDGTYCPNRIISILTTTSLEDNSIYFLNRPGRFRYHKKFTVLTTEEIEQLSKDNSILNNALKLIRHVTLDQFLKLREECRVFPYLTSEELVSDFNVNLKRYNKVTVTYTNDRLETFIVDYYNLSPLDNWEIVLKTKAIENEYITLHYNNVAEFINSYSFKDKEGNIYRLHV